MIAPSGCFAYAAVILQGSSAGWHGRAQPASDPTRHPGLLGRQPHLDLLGGTLRVRCAESWISRKTNRHYVDWGPPASEVRLAVGPVIEAFAQNGDELVVYRRGTGDCGVELRTGRELRAGLGAIRGGESIQIEEDPRADETQLYHLAASLEAVDTALIWLDVSDPNCEAVVASIKEVPARRLIIAIAGPNIDERRRMNHRVAKGPLPPGRGSCSYVDVDGRFTSRDQWLSYLRSLPTSRPTDLWIRFTASARSILVREGEYAFMQPWHLFVQRVSTPGLPGQLSQLAIVRQHAAVSREMVIESAHAIAAGLSEISA